MDRHEKVMELALRRGFLWPSYEIYGGASGFYDYGPLGATLKKKIEDLWRRFYCVQEGFLEISSPTVGPEEVFIASGHVSNFVDPMVECQKCHEAFRADHLVKGSLEVRTDGLSYKELARLIEDNNMKCPECGGKLGEVWSYNLMFKTHIGPGSRKVGYLRPETAQGMFVLFNRLYAFYRKRLPFGVAQIGRAYRNEISPRQGVIRLREFTQAEVEIFVHPLQKVHKDFVKYAGDELLLMTRGGEERRIAAREAVGAIVAHELLCYHLALTQRFLQEAGIPGERIRFRQHLKTEMAHYAADCWDAEVFTERFGWIEVVGIADRTDYDLLAHQKASNAELAAFIHYETPRLVKKKMLEPNMVRMGPQFKGKAGKIIEALKGLGEGGVETFAKDGQVTLELDGERVVLGKEYLGLKEVEERVVGEKVVPHVVEPSYGMDRILYCVLEAAYLEREGRTIMTFKNAVAPVEVAVFPLVQKGELTEYALRIVDVLKGEGLMVIYDEGDSIGRRYARVDEAGVPYALTVDLDSLKDDKVTVRERETARQVRVETKSLPQVLKGLLEGKREFAP